MKVAFTKMFNKQFREINNEKLAQAVSELMMKVEEAESLNDLQPLKKFKGHKIA
jgi:hypothetical protein